MSLEAGLARVLGEGMISDPERLRAASADLWPLNLMQRRAGIELPMPRCLVEPRDEAEAQQVMELCVQHRVPVVPAGTLTGVTGGANAVEGAVTLSTRRMNRILEVDPVCRTATVEAGVLGIALEKALGAQGLTLGHFPTSVHVSTMGGFLACRSAGQASTRYGKAENFTLGMRVILADGAILDTGTAPSPATGPDLRQVFLGSEGTLGLITQASVRVWAAPGMQVCAGFRFASTERGLEAMRLVLQAGLRPAILRLYDEEDSVMSLQALDLAPGSGAVLLCVNEGPAWETGAAAAELASLCGRAGGIELGPAPARQWLEHRYDMNTERLLRTLTPTGAVVDTVEISASWPALAAIHARVKSALAQQLLVLAHFSHAYSEGGAAYFTLAGSAPDEARARELHQRAWTTIMEATLAHHGAISHHHGIGLARADWMQRANPEGLRVLSALKSALDPHRLLNPGKLGL